MADYNPIGDYAWPDDLFDDTGQIDQDRLMEILEANPELMELFQREMYEEGDYDMMAPDSAAAVDYTQTFSDIYTDCIMPNISGVTDSITPLLIACLMCWLVGRLAWSRPTIVHLLVTMAGAGVLYKFFMANSLMLAAYTVMALALLVMKAIRTRVGGVVSLLTLLYVILCEFMVPAERWHNVRGAQMVLSMKVISLGFDLSNEHVKDAPLLSVMSYLLHPGNVIFGPWISYQYYIDGLTAERRWLDIRWLYHVIKSLILSVIFLVWSSCIISYLLPDYSMLNKWVYAYRDAQSFRFSHYFICSLSECTLLLSGIATYTRTKAGDDSSTTSPLTGDNSSTTSPRTGELSSHITVSQPLNIEVPRSLVEVVTSWNLSMHKWLKNYVFRISRPKFGTFAAILLTYIASALLHGLNFQLAAVLLSLGFYSFIEHKLRHKLSDTFSMCIGARRCQPTCEHRHKHLTPLTIIINVLFTCLAMYHLAYLGVMFDTTEDSEQETGYSMYHTLEKWSKLSYSSHIVAATCYLFYWLIK